MGVGVVRPEAYSTTRVSAAYGYKQVLRQRVPASRPIAGPHGLLTWGIRQPRTRGRSAWKLGPRSAVRVRRLACERV